MTVSCTLPDSETLTATDSATVIPAGQDAQPSQDLETSHPTTTAATRFGNQADPVDPSTGEFHAVSRPFSVPGIPPIVIQWQYSSSNTSSGLLGPGWRLAPDPYLDTDPGNPNILRVTDISGTTVTFYDEENNLTYLPLPRYNQNTEHTPGSDGALAPPAASGVITYDSEERSYTWTRPDGTKLIFAALAVKGSDHAARLVEVKTQQGQSISFRYRDVSWANIDFAAEHSYSRTSLPPPGGDVTYHPRIFSISATPGTTQPSERGVIFQYYGDDGNDPNASFQVKNILSVASLTYGDDWSWTDTGPSVHFSYTKLDDQKYLTTVRYSHPTNQYAGAPDLKSIYDQTNDDTPDIR